MPAAVPFCTRRESRDDWDDCLPDALISDRSLLPLPGAHTVCQSSRSNRASALHFITPRRRARRWIKGKVIQTEAQSVINDDHGVGGRGTCT